MPRHGLIEFFRSRSYVRLLFRGRPVSRKVPSVPHCGGVIDLLQNMQSSLVRFNILFLCTARPNLWLMFNNRRAAKNARGVILFYKVILINRGAQEKISGRDGKLSEPVFGATDLIRLMWRVGRVFRLNKTLERKQGKRFVTNFHTLYNIQGVHGNFFYAK